MFDTEEWDQYFAWTNMCLDCMEAVLLGVDINCLVHSMTLSYPVTGVFKQQAPKGFMWLTHAWTIIIGLFLSTREIEEGGILVHLGSNYWSTVGSRDLGGCQGVTLVRVPQFLPYLLAHSQRVWGDKKWEISEDALEGVKVLPVIWAKNLTLTERGLRC